MTKSKLLASTMLVAASTMFAAGSANAVELKIGGFGVFEAGYADNDKAAGVNGNFDVKQDAEIYFRGEETLDNGMKVGVLFEFEAGNGGAGGTGIGTGGAQAGNSETGFDESFAWVKASWGQLNIGNNDLATGYVGGVTTVGPIGIIKSDANNWIPGNSEINNTDVDLGLGDSQNITYFTPRVAGFQAIVSYTPDSSDTNTSAFNDSELAGLHNGISGAVTWAGKMGGTAVKLQGGYTQAETSDTAGDSTAWGYAIAGDISFSNNFRITGAYAKEQIGDTDEFWGVSGLYKLNKADTVSLAYSKGTETQNGNSTTIGQDNKNTVLTLGYERDLGKGVSFNASLFKNHASGPGLTAAQSNDGVGLVSGLALKF